MNPSELLKKYWGHARFRPAQEEIIQAVLDGSDVLAILPTGGGKSVCFQIPALATPGICLVVSPLIALMEDQVQRLKEMDIPSEMISSGMSASTIDQLMDACEQGNLKFLYVSPERLENKSFQESLVSLPIQMLAVDEAHCISQWGYDFRPSYLHIAKIKSFFPKIPVIALTASATQRVQTDILEKLSIPKAKVFTTSFERKNLYYQAENCDYKTNKISALFKSTPGTGIIYCRTRKRTVEINEVLIQKGIQSDFYHAGLDQETRKSKQIDWIEGRTQVMVCTNAFGMGIDKADVRLVVHADLPDCLENYYQEAGRAGRDGKPSQAYLLYAENEIEQLKKLPDVKFPPIATIRKVYQALANYHQMPSGSGEGQAYDFDLDDFIEKFKLNNQEVVYSLQALKQEEIIDYTDKVFKPSTIEFTSNRYTLEDFQKIHTDLEPFIQALLRTYAGIWDGPVRINEKQLAWNLKIHLDLLTMHLHTLHKHGIISYQPKKENTHITYLQNRIVSGELEINYTAYIERKKAYANRIQTMIDFAKTTECRSVFIGNYFGDRTIQPCSNCDNCRHKKKGNSSTTEMKKAIELTIALLQAEPVNRNELINKTRLSPELLDACVEFLISESKIDYDLSGKIFLK